MGSKNFHSKVATYDVDACASTSNERYNEKSKKQIFAPVGSCSSKSLRYKQENKQDFIK